MGIGQVCDVHVVADAGAVGGGPVGAEDPGRLAARQRVKHHRDQVEHPRIAQFGGGRACHVEVSECGVTQACGAGNIGQQPLADQLRFAVRVDRLSRGVFADQPIGRHAVGGGRRREQKAVDARIDAALQQRGHGGDVLAVVPQRACHRLAHLFLGGDVDHRGDPEVAEDRRHHTGITNVTLNKRDTVRQPVCRSGRQVVEHRHPPPRGGQRMADVGADVAGAPGHQDRATVVVCVGHGARL